MSGGLTVIKSEVASWLFFAVVAFLVMPRGR